MSLMPPILLLTPEYLHFLPAPNTSLTPMMPPNGPNIPTPLGAPNAPYATYTPSGPWVPTLPASPPIHPLLAPQHPLTPPSFLSLTLCNWPSSWVCAVYNIWSVVVKNTSAVLLSSANFCNISQNMHSNIPVAAQHWKTNKVVWTWKYDWPP